MNLHPKKLFPEIDNIELLNHQVVTKRDLLNFGNALLHEIQSGKPAPEQPAQWLKSSEVRKLLKIWKNGTMSEEYLFWDNKTYMDQIMGN